jgi:hypothetical protein
MKKLIIIFLSILLLLLALIYVNHSIDSNTLNPINWMGSIKHDLFGEIFFSTILSAFFSFIINGFTNL